MGIWDTIKDKAEETIGNADVSSVVNAFFQKQREQMVPVVKVVDPSAVPTIQQSAQAAAASISQPQYLIPLLALVGVGAFLMFKRGK